MDSMDISAYFERIGWDGPPTPSLETLSGLFRAHTACIPFENFDVLLGRGIRLGLAAVQAKLIRDRRGGYCFEHATLFAAVLERLGFRPSRHTARVLLRMSRDQAPSTHMFLTVPVGAITYVVDCGFGELAPTTPIPLALGVTPHVRDHSHWMVRDRAGWLLRAWRHGIAIDCWSTALDGGNASDFEVANHYCSTHPDSAFVNRIVARAMTPDGRVTLSNRDIKIWRGGQLLQEQIIDRAELQAFLARHFGFDLPEVQRLRVPTIPDWQ